MKEYSAGAQPQAKGPAALAVDEAARKAAALMADMTPEQAAELRAECVQSVSVVGAGYGRWPDVGNLEVPCCTAAAVLGHQWCTCWEPVFDVDQADAQTDLAAGLQPKMCGDCAYRPKSPERTGDPDAATDGEGLMHLVVTGQAFWCHQGLRRPTHWRHPAGATVPGSPNDYKPLIVDRTPYQADGTPGLLCAGWVALRLKHVTDSIDTDGIIDAEPVRTCRVCGCTQDRACNGGCAWVGNQDLCTRCKPLEDLFGDGGATDPVDLLTDGILTAGLDESVAALVEAQTLAADDDLDYDEEG